MPHLGGTYTVYRSLRVGLASRGVAVRWIGLGTGAAAVLRDECWVHEHAHGEAVARVANGDHAAARQLVDHLEREGYGGVIICALSGQLETNIVRYLSVEAFAFRALLLGAVTWLAWRYATGAYALQPASRSVSRPALSFPPGPEAWSGQVGTEQLG